MNLGVWRMLWNYLGFRVRLTFNQNVDKIYTIYN